MKDNQLQKLLKKTQAQATEKAARKRPSFDATLDATKQPGAEDGPGADAEEIFKEMKRREF